MHHIHWWDGGKQRFGALMMPTFGSEPARTGPRFRPMFKEIIELKPRSGSRFRE